MDFDSIVFGIGLLVAIAITEVRYHRARRMVVSAVADQAIREVESECGPVSEGMRRYAYRRAQEVVDSLART